VCDRIIRGLFVSEALDWVEAGSFASGPHSEYQTNSNRYGETSDDSP